MIILKRNYNKEKEIKKELDYVHKLAYEKRFEEAYEKLDYINLKYPENYMVKFEFGFLNFEQRKFKEAYEIFEQLTSKPNNMYAYYYMAKIKMLNSCFDEAKHIYKLIVENDFKNKNYALLELAKISKYNKKFDEALNYLDQIELCSKELDNAYTVEKADIYCQIKKYEESYNILNKKITNIHERKILNKALYILAYDENKMENYDESLKILERINEKDLKNDILRAQNYYYTNKYLECIELCNKVKKDDYNLEIILIKSYIRINELNKALNLLNKYVKENPDLNFLIALCYTKMKKIEEAKKHFQILIDKKSHYYINSMRQLMFIDIKENKDEEAYKKYRELLKLNAFKNDNITQIQKEQIGVYLSNKLNIDCEFENNNYATNQIKNYSYDRAKGYILEKIKNNNCKDINIDELLSYIHNNLIDNNYYENSLFDIYIIKDNSCFKEYDYIKVLTLPNTKKIINILPCDKYGYDNANENTKEIKIESQIDKFNKRFSKTLKKINN